jgi:hypothetical protein
MYYRQKKSSAPSNSVLSIYPNDARYGAADRGEYREDARLMKPDFDFPVGVLNRRLGAFRRD